MHIAPLHADTLQLHAVSSSKPFGAESLVIRIGLNVSFIVSHPFSRLVFDSLPDLNGVLSCHEWVECLHFLIVSD